MKIYLSGFMGSGKTTVGRQLAERLELPFVDLDEEIERRQGATIREIFARGGEAEFRRIELAVLASLGEEADLVVALGGGTVTVPAAAELVHGSGVVVWLNPAFATVVERIGGLGKEDRPLFRDEVQAWELYRARLDAYRRADLEIGVGPAESPEEIAARIALWIAERR